MSYPFPDLVTTAEVIVDVPKLTNRANLPAIISRASTVIGKYCGKIFGPISIINEAYDGHNLPRIWLKKTPVISVSGITIDGTALDNTLGDAWTVDPKSGELVRGMGTSATRFQAWFPEGKQNILVSYMAGDLFVPDDIKQAAILTVAYYAQSDRLADFVKSEKIGDYSYEFFEAPRDKMPNIAKAILAAYVEDWII